MFGFTYPGHPLSFVLDVRRGLRLRSSIKSDRFSLMKPGDLTQICILFKFVKIHVLA